MTPWQWAIHLYGGDNGSGPIYLWWSGFFSDVTIFAACVFALLKHNCHVKGCWRFRHTAVDPEHGWRACPEHHSKGDQHGVGA